MKGKVLMQLARKGVNIDYTTHFIKIPDTITVGIHSLGKIDYLVNYCGWKCTKVTATAIQKQKAEEKLAKKLEREEAKNKYKENKKLNKR